MDQNKQKNIRSTNTQEIPQEAFDWYDEYCHGIIDRRTFLAKLATLSAAGITLATLSSALLPNYAQAEQVSFNDPSIKARYVGFDSPNGHKKCQGYLVEPTGREAASHPAVLVVHENRGLNPYVKDVARRLAKQGYLAFAPDALFPVGGYPGNDDEGRAMQKALDREKLEHDFIAAARFIKQHPKSNRALGAVGFCFGGYIVNMLAATLGDELGAAVPFYGTPAAQPLRKNIRVPLLVQLAEKDPRVNATWPEYKQDLEKISARYVMHEYANTQHGFHNDSTARYDQQQAELAWSRTLQFFDLHLVNNKAKTQQKHSSSSYNERVENTEITV